VNRHFVTEQQLRETGKIMHAKLQSRVATAALCLAAILAAPSARAELSPEDLAKIAQNPVGNLISVPFQENAYLNTGPLDKTQNVLNIQPVIPIRLNSDWNIITRTILPIVSLPAFAPGQGRTNGIADLQISAFLSPANPGGWIWGVGVATQWPTHSNEVLGNNNVGLGPSFVVLHLEQGSPWVYGVLVNNVWSVGNSGNPSSNATRYNNGLLQPFLNYNFEGGAYLTTSPIFTVNWEARGSQQWTVPMGAGVGKLFKIGRLPVNTQISGYYYVVRPDFAPNWQVRAQVQFMFPK
jgi:hypothetical protein